jgi:hypothetical protein
MCIVARSDRPFFSLGREKEEERMVVVGKRSVGGVVRFLGYYKLDSNRTIRANDGAGIWTGKEEAKSYPTRDRME